MSEIVRREIEASVGRLVDLGRSKRLTDDRIREIVLGSMGAACRAHPTDPYHQETLWAVLRRALDARLLMAEWGRDGGNDGNNEPEER